MVLIFTLTFHPVSFPDFWKCSKGSSDDLVLLSLSCFPTLFCSWERFWYLSNFSLSYIFTLWSNGVTKCPWWQVIFLSINLKSSFLVRIGWFVCISKYLRILCVSFSRMDSSLRIDICQHGRPLISCTIPNWSLFPPSHACIYIPFEPVCCIYDLCV